MIRTVGNNRLGDNHYYKCSDQARTRSKKPPSKRWASEAEVRSVDQGHHVRNYRFATADDYLAAYKYFTSLFRGNWSRGI